MGHVYYAEDWTRFSWVDLKGDFALCRTLLIRLIKGETLGWVKCDVEKARAVTNTIFHCGGRV